MLTKERVQELLNINRQNLEQAKRVFFGYQGAVQMLEDILLDIETNEQAEEGE